MTRFRYRSQKGVEMENILEKIRDTKQDKTVGLIRIMIGIIILSTGVMKLLVPMLWNAWSGQLSAAHIPFHSFNLWFVPFAEIITGLLLISGFFSRLGSLILFFMMTVATYVHLTVHDPSLFPLQPEAPVMPLALIAAGAYVFWHGGGAWSTDLKSTRNL